MKIRKKKQNKRKEQERNTEKGIKQRIQKYIKKHRKQKKDTHKNTYETLKKLSKVDLNENTVCKFFFEVITSKDNNERFNIDHTLISMQVHDFIRNRCMKQGTHIQHISIHSTRQ